MEVEDPIDIAIHHITNACIVGDVSSLDDECSEFLQKYEVDQLTEKQMEQLKMASMEASMEGYLACLTALFNWHIPVHELCPVIAAYHGHRAIIEFSRDYLELDCQEAWNKYFIWCVKNTLGSSPDEGKSLSQTMTSMKLKSASEWLQEYKQVGGHLLIV